MGHINTLSLVREISTLHKLFSLSLITLALSACGGGGASYAIFLGADTPATIENNNLTSGNGGNGGNARYSDDALSGGDGGWSFGIFDSNPNDNFAVFVSDNQFTIGQGGADGAPKTGTGETGDTNL